MSLRKQLLLISLATLLMPWAGCQYALEMEEALRQGKREALLASAATVANALATQPQGIYRDPALAATGIDTRRDMYAVVLPAPAVLDGYPDDWGPDQAALKAAGIVTGDAYGVGARYLAGVHGRYLYLFIQVSDAHVSWLLPTGGTGHDRVALRLVDAQNISRDFVFETGAQGRVTPRLLDPGTPEHNPRELRLAGHWQATEHGYNLEMQVPLELVGPRLGFAVIDGSDFAGAAPRATLGNFDPHAPPDSADGRPGVVVYPSVELSRRLGDFHGAGQRIVVTDRFARIVAKSGTLDRPLSGAGQNDRGNLHTLTERLFRGVLGENAADYPRRDIDGERMTGPELTTALEGGAASDWYRGPDNTAVISASRAVETDGQVTGAVLMEQRADAILTLTNTALSRLLSLTLLASLAAAIALLGYATLLSLRVRRLRNAAESALSPDGTLRAAVPGTGARDEIGDLARSFQTLLDQQRQYTDYLRTVAGKLSHELRTPLAVVRSSLENLDDEVLSDDARLYATRARDGAERLRVILSAMSEATRVEEAIRGADSEAFDLRELVHNAGNAYRDVYPAHPVEISLPDQACPMQGVGELIVQMLDKLMDNAADFSPSGQPIRISLESNGHHHRLSVANSGPLLADTMRHRMFDSMVTMRDAASPSDTAHLGLGLNIVRLIVEYHRGTVVAQNLADGSGVEFVVRLAGAPTRRE